MKYVALRHPITREIQFRMGVMCMHQDLAAHHINKGFTVRSAGFLRVLATGRVETFGQSTGLGLAPHEEDAKALTAFYGAALTEGGYVRQTAAPFRHA